MAVKKGRPPKTYSQAERIINMLRALASRSMTIKDLSDEFGICRRQVYRDIGRIQEEGHPLEQSDRDGEKTWQLPLTYKGLPPITVTPYELMALHFAKSHVDYLSGTPFVENLDSLIKKVEGGLPQPVQFRREVGADSPAPSTATVRLRAKHCRDAAPSLPPSRSDGSRSSRKARAAGRAVTPGGGDGLCDSTRRQPSNHIDVEENEAA